MDIGDLSREQLFWIFEKMSVKTNLQTMFLRTVKPILDLPIQGNVLSKAINNLEVFFATKFCFSQAQMKKILEDVTEPTSKLRKLSIGFTEHMPQLSPDCLRAINLKLSNNTLQIRKKEIRQKLELEEKEADQASLNQIKKKPRREGGFV